MDRKFKQVEGHPDLARDTVSHAIINRNNGAYELAKNVRQLHNNKEMK